MLFFTVGDGETMKDCYLRATEKSLRGGGIFFGGTSKRREVMRCCERGAGLWGAWGRLLSSTCPKRKGTIL